MCVPFFVFCLCPASLYYAEFLVCGLFCGCVCKIQLHYVCVHNASGCMWMINFTSCRTYPRFHNLRLNLSLTARFWHLAVKPGHRETGSVNQLFDSSAAGSEERHQLDPSMWWSYTDDHNYWLGWSLVPDDTVFCAHVRRVWFNGDLPHVTRMIQLLTNRGPPADLFCFQDWGHIFNIV